MLEEENLKLLNQAQKDQVLMQWDKHQHGDLVADFPLTPFGDEIKDFIVKKGVWNPFIVSARHHAAYMFYHTSLFYEKTVLDVGCGTGIIALVMAKYGAKNVLASDVSEPAVKNTQENIERQELKNISAIQSSLFEKIEGKFDCITFMQPYFPGNPPEGDTISASMLANPNLIRDFLKEAPNHLNDSGVIVMPSFSLAGEINNPATIAEEFGFDCETTFVSESITGLQKGTIRMHELRLFRKK